jgi:hypothetical protein
MPDTFVTIGHIHDPSINVDRLRIETNRSLDEAPTLRLSGPDLSPRTFTADESRNMLQAAYDEAVELADGEAVSACVILLDAVHEFLGLPASASRISRDQES